MNTQRNLLEALTKNQLDRVTLLNNLKKFKVNFNEGSAYVILKYRLKIKLLDNISQIVSECREKEEIEKSMKEAEDLLRYHNEKISRLKYKCSFVGCLYESRRHLDYIRHIQRVHPEGSNLKCLYGLKCLNVFSSLALLKDHILHFHQRKHTNEASVSSAVLLDNHCRCCISKCGGAQFTSMKALMLHLQNFHAKNGEMVSCIFENCSTKSDNAESLRVHFQQKHLKLKMCNLKQSNKVSLHSEPETGVFVVDGDSMVDSLEEDRQSVYEDQVDYDPVGDIDGQDSEDEEEDIDEVFLMAYCDFMNRLLNFQFIPQSSIQLICEEYLKNYMKSNAAKAKVLRTSILKNIPNTSEDNIKKVLADFEENDSFLKAQKSLDSGFKRLQYLKSNFKYVDPKEILLNPNGV